MRFVAPIDTEIYGTPYAAGDTVDVTSWNRKQLIQFLGSGLITPAVVGDAAPDAYTHTQSAPVEVWDVFHAIPFVPSITVIDSTGEAVMGDIEVLSDTHIRLTFSAPFSGSAYLS